MSSADPVLDAIVDLVDTTGFGALGVHVLVGDDAAEHHRAPDVRREVHSVAKGVAALVTGIAADDGLVDVDAPVAATLPERCTGAGTDTITLRHLLTMTSGIDMPWSPTQLTGEQDLAAAFLARPSRGRVFQYANASTYTAMRVLERHVGDVGVFAAERLFVPLGIADVTWDRCPRGHVAGGEGIALRVAETARLGRLLRDGGVVDGRRVVGAAWCRQVLGEQVRRPEAGPGYQRYGLSGWGGPGRLWRLHGAYGQLVLVDAVADTVVTVAADDHAGADGFAAAVADELARRFPDR